MLENVRTAINAMLTGGNVQAYSINTGTGTRSLQHFSYDQLLKIEDRLVARKAAELSSNGRTYAGFEAPL